MLEPRTDAQPTPLGTRIGGFLLQERLGIGGMAEVFLAARAGPERTEFAALKRLLPHLTFDAEFVRMFLAEVKLTAELDHPGIARVLEYGTGEGGHFLAMEYVHGHDVRDVLGAVSDRGADLAFALGVVADLADALHYAHELRAPDGSARGLVHRDVSPSNVRICSDGAVKLIDFGIAHVSGQTHVTRAGTLKGKVGYMSPEQCRAERVDRRTDIFALGVMLYELTTGRRAFYGPSDLVTLARIIQGQYTSPQAAKPELPTEIAALIVRMLSTNPNKRPSSAAEVSSALRTFAARHGLALDAQSRAENLRWLFGESTAPNLPASTPTLHASQPKTQLAPAPAVATKPAAKPEEKPARGRAPLILAFTALVLAVGLGGYFAGQRATTDAPVRAAAPAEDVAIAALPIEPEPQPEPAPAAEPEPEPQPQLQPASADEPEPEPEPVIEVEEPEAPRPRKRPPKSARKAIPSTTTPSGPTIDPDSLLAPSLRQ